VGCTRALRTRAGAGRGVAAPEGIAYGLAMAPPRGLDRAALLVALSAAACSVDALDLRGRPCPCPDDLACDEATDTCVDPASIAGAGGAGASGNAGGAAGAGGASCTGPDCPVVVDGFDIDPTEVTRAQYQAFLDAAVDPATQPARCVWNTTFDAADGGECEQPFDAAVEPDRPVTCVDVCDARGYCEWRGRRLCGRIGGGMLIGDPAQAGDPALSQWHRACTEAGEKPFPYGDTFLPQVCKTSGSPGGASPLAVRSFPLCEGGYDGLFDMSGNVEEWEDACTAGATEDPADDGCYVRGGAFWSQEADARCDALEYRPPGNTVSHDWGFRCCSE
jgi:formylglycine-generating enzyme required for sulfatase activity